MSDVATIDQTVRESLDGRPVFVTGSDGFVAGHLVETLLDFGAHVHAFVRATSSSILTNIGPVRDRVVLHRGDLTDRHAVANALRDLKSDGGRPIIFHLGAQAHVGESWARPYETIASNVLGTLNLLQAVVDLELDVHRIDVAGSSEEYGNVQEDLRSHYRFDEHGGLILDELSPLNPQSVYATSKVATDFLARNFQSAYGIPCVVARMFNNYGPRQNPRFVTGTIITQALTTRRVVLGYVKAKRDFCFVRDGALGHVHVGLFGLPGSVYVFGSGRTISIFDWFGLIQEIGTELGLWSRLELRTDAKERARLGGSEVEELRVDYTRLNQLSGWHPQHSWQEGLRATIRWFADNRDKWRSRVDWI